MQNEKVFNVVQGGLFTLHGTKYSIIARINMDQVLARPTDGARIAEPISISDILDNAHKNDAGLKRKLASLETIDDVSWKEVIKRQAEILSVKEGKSPKDAADALGITVHHLSVLREKYELFGIEGLIKEPPSGGAGKSRLDNKREDILLGAIKSEYLTKQKKCIARVFDKVKELCNAAKIPEIGRNTVYRRCYAVDKKEAEKKRQGSKSAKDKYSQSLDGYHEATRPLEIIQVDHTAMDVIIVDEEFREPIGRPYLTIAIDVYSRMVFGFYISLDPPSAMSTALCLQQGICKKDKWLSDRGVKHSWGIHGLLESLHMDNGKDFHSKTLRRGCEKHEIHMHYRPVGKPEFGAHIERLIGTFMGHMKVLPGATFSNIEEKGDYDAEAESAMTLPELEKWFATLVTGRYHKEVHSSLHMSPEKKFLEGLQGNQNVLGAGINNIICNEVDLLMDFTPFFEPTVQNYGIRIDHVHYNSVALKPFINAIDPKTGKKRKFTVRRDPRDISMVHFFDPVKKRYVAIPYREKSRPKISLAEHRWAIKVIKERGKLDSVTEDEIFRTLSELRKIEEQAVKKTKKTRRRNEKRKLDRLAKSKKTTHTRPALPEIDEVPVDEEVVPFEGIEIL